MIPQLPYDLLKEIVDIVASTRDYRSLFSLSLTCKTILVLSRAHIFSTMTLVPRDWDRLSATATPESYRLGSLSINRQLFRVKIVEALVRSSPGILRYVRTLHLQSHQSNYNDAAFIDLLSKFSNLSTLTIGSYENVAGQVIDPYKPKRSWNSFPQSYQDSIAQLIRRSPIEKLSFDSLGDIPTSALKNCSNLMNLSLYCSTFSSYDHPGSLSCLPACSIPIELKELYFRYDITAARPLLDFAAGPPIVNPATLETFVFELHSASENGREHEIVKDATCLEDLIISDPINSYTNFLRNILDCVHPHSYTTLTFLRFTIIYRSIAQPNPVPSAILRGREFRCLERLEIVLDVESSEYETPLLEDLPLLDTVLSSPHYSSLRLLRIDCAASHAITALWDQIARAQFPKIVESNPTLDFTYHTFHGMLPTCEADGIPPFSLWSS